jgi:hypothetical protein
MGEGPGAQRHRLTEVGPRTAQFQIRTPRRGPVGRLIRPVTETLPGRSVAQAGRPSHVSLALCPDWHDASPTPAETETDASAAREAGSLARRGSLLHTNPTARNAGPLPRGLESYLRLDRGPWFTFTGAPPAARLSRTRRSGLNDQHLSLHRHIRLQEVRIGLRSQSGCVHPTDGRTFSMQ